MSYKSVLAAMVVMVSVAGQANAQPFNQPAPTGPVILNLTGTPIPQSYQQYNTSFVASSTSSFLSFAFRDDPAFLFLDSISVTTGGGSNLLTNGGFESGVLGNNAPVGWTYLNTFGASFAGVVANNNPQSGSNNYYDGAVQAYDGITQQLPTSIGGLYNVSFFLSENSGLSTFSAVSTNGNITDTGGNGINLVVYAGDSIPVRFDAVPGPIVGAGLPGLLAVCGALVAIMRRRRLNAALS